MREIDKNLFDAVASNDVVRVKNLIDEGANVMARDHEEATPLHRTLLADIAQILIDNGADIMARTKTGFTPLHIAKGPEIAEVLIKNGAVIDAESKQGKTALWLNMLLAARHLSIVRTLLNNGADINCCTEMRISPLHIAARYGDTMLTKLCIEHGANVNLVNMNKHTPYDTAILNKHEDVAKEIQKHGGHTSDQEPTDDAAVISTYTLGEWLVNVIKGNQPLGSLPTLGDVNARDADNCTALHWAAYQGSIELIEFLINKGAYVNARDNDCKTPLSYAKTPEIRQLLIEHGAIE